MTECKHKKDKYGCVEGCKGYYPVINRESIIAEMDSVSESEYCECEKRCEDCGKLIIKN